MFVITLLLVALKVLLLIRESHQLCIDVSPPENGNIYMDRFYNFYQVSCDPDYIIKGNPRVNCIENEWESEPPTCIEAVCETLTPPENGKVECDEGPLNPGKKCTFTCFDGHELQGVEVRRCLPNFIWSGPSALCIPKSGVVCDLPPPLQNGRIIGCSSKQLPREYEKCYFLCNQGYVLNGPSILTCRANGKLTDDEGKEDMPVCTRRTPFQEPVSKRDYGRAPQKTRFGGNHLSTETASDNSCSNLHCEQMCKIIEGQAQCKCRRGYILNLDKRTCKVNKPCNINNGGCGNLVCFEKENKTVQCGCKEGYIISSNGKSCQRKRGQELYPSSGKIPSTPSQTCESGNGNCNPSNHRTNFCNAGYTPHPIFKSCIDINECRDESLNRCQHRCHNTLGGYTCSCNPGYVLYDGYNCKDINECSDERLNQCEHHCRNTEGGYTCLCKPGYILYDSHRCKGCRKNSYWSDEFNGCVDCPRNSHTKYTKYEGMASIEDCICNSGFTGNPRANMECQDVNECDENNFGCSGTCVNIPGGAYCTCPSGFTLDKDNKTCIDIDECSIKNGGCEGLCRNLNGSFTCFCGRGYVTSDKDPYLCEDVDECMQDNGGCQQMCVNYRGGFSCACDAGYRLGMDLKSCNEIQCPRLPLPNYSTMKCKKAKIPFNEKDYYPINTVCSFKCLEGYKNTKNNSDEMKCLRDGSWKGTLPACKPKRCSSLPALENGRLHPNNCFKEGAAVSQRCTYICKPGYEIEGQSIFICQNNLTWDGEDPPVCKPVEIQPVIQCPEDIYVTLPLGKATRNVTVPKPSTNTASFEVNPSWIHAGENQEFSVGTTKITFTAFSSVTNDTAECVTTVTVMDKEPPVFEYCPDPIIIEGASGEGEFVTWNEPVANDNVELVSVFSIMKPNITLTPGTYFVEYIAKDSSGNTASCSFGISIIGMNCSRLADPPHGESNCMDLKYGRICMPQCDFGYMRDPDAPDFYSCDDSGIWEPSDVVSECLKFSPKNSSECEDGFELKINEENGEEFCIECPSSTGWSSASRKCEEITK